MSMERYKRDQDQRRLISAPDAAEMLGLSKRTIYLLTSDGRLKHCRIGDRVLIPLEEIDRIIKENMVESPTLSRE